MSCFFVTPQSSGSATYPRNILLDVTDRTATGYTGDQLLVAYPFPANTLQVGDLFRLQWGMSNATQLAGTEAKFFFNTTASLSGASQLFRYAYATSACAANNQRHGLVKSGNNVFVTVNPAFSAAASDINVTTGSVPPLVSFDPTVDSYLIVDIYLNNINESFVLKYVLMDVYR